VRIAVNAADDLSSRQIYLTVTGTSAEAGDDGQVGRGNRVGGLITPSRPTTLEAAAGKNVVMHVGKSYNIVANQIAADIVATCSDIADVVCLLVSRIGRPVETPQIVELQVRTREGIPLDEVRARVEAIARTRLRGLAALPQLLLDRASAERPAMWPGVRLF
jgi:S-adenosylmethionine synthetase